MNIFDVLLVPLFLGLVGSVEPCSLGINLIFLGYLQGKPRALRLAQGAIFLLVRALFMTALGVLFGSIGQAIVGFQLYYRPVIAALFVVVGVLFLLSLRRPLPAPEARFVATIGGGKVGAPALGTVFGLVIPACATPLLAYLLGKTVLKGDLLFGAISLMVFGAGMSLPLLLVAASEGANRFLERAARGSGPLAYAAGLLLIGLGLAAFSPPLMEALMVPFMFVAGLFGG